MQANTKSLPVPGELFEVDGCEAFLIRAEQKSDRYSPWVWYAPTLPPYPDANEKWMFERFLARGITIAGIDVGESYGSPVGRHIYSSLYRHMVGLEFSSRPALLPRSRGGLIFYNWAVEHADSVSCIAGIYPVCSLVSFLGADRACEAYGMTPGELTDALAQNNPIERLNPLVDANVPIYHIHGDRDDVVPIEGNSGDLAERYTTLGGQMTLNVAAGQGHSLWEGFFRDEVLITFVIEHAGANRG
ncbi:MAG: alpha/beta hydrolase [Gemmatimonadetes bacterium]|nr:alpha/beta hydrolase [Gemmatimonadota bacterium]